MAKRWPPILGVTGFDGGSKSAIALATRTGRLQGGEGIDRGPGACCHPDGTCDELSEFDCLSSGGEWRGAGEPCDPNPCPSGCPPTCPSVTFSGVEFCCFTDGFRSVLFDETIQVVNGVLFSPTAGPGLFPCCVCNSYPIEDDIHFYSWPDSDCSGDFDTDSQLALVLSVANISGVWHIMLYNFGDLPPGISIIFFYGTTTSLAVPAANEIVCGPFQTFDNPLIECLELGPIDAFPSGFNGTATLS